MKKVWYVATFRYEGEDGKEYFCRTAKSFEVYSPLPLSDKNLVALHACETKRNAESIANVWNDIYRRQGNLATATRWYKM